MSPETNLGSPETHPPPLIGFWTPGEGERGRGTAKCLTRLFTPGKRGSADFLLVFEGSRCDCTLFVTGPSGRWPQRPTTCRASAAYST